MWNKIWNIDGTVQKFHTSSFKFSTSTNFPVYVNDEKYFYSKLPAFKITNDQSKFFTLDNPYFTACCASYCATYLCGISVEHFMTEDPLISTIAKYHFYYLMKKFLRSPQKLNTHMSDEHYELIRKHIPVKYIWKWEFDQTRERLDLWLSKKHHAGVTVKDYYTSMSKYGGQIGIHYMKRMGRTYHSLNDYGLFVAQKSNGLTPLGQLLFQQSVESFVYSVLGAQAATRWPIVGQGAKSLQTQVEFKKIVHDTIVEDDQTITIGNMRKAIADTHVILNTAISPGMILIPGDLIILTEKIPGYNNILTVADETMKFGLNDKVNKETKRIIPKVKPKPRSENKNDDTNIVTSSGTDTTVGKRNTNRVEREDSARYYQRSYIRSTPIRTLTSVALGAGALGFAGAIGYSLL